MRKSAERAVLRDGAKPILRSAKSKVAKDSGTLKKSLSAKVVYSKAGLSARIGPRAGYKYEKKVTGRRRDKGNGKKIDAQEVAWYQEIGTAKMPAHPFIRPALDAAKGEVLSSMAAGLDKHLTRVAARLAKK